MLAPGIHYYYAKGGIHTGGAGADRDGDPDKPAHGSHTTNGPESRHRSEHRVKSRSLLAALCIGGNVKLNRLQDLIGGSAMQGNEW